MGSALIFVHVLLCCFAIGLGSVTLHDLLLRHMVVRRLTWFLRFSLGSNLAILFIQLHHLVPAQKVAMMGVYAAGIVTLAWRAFHLRGIWRAAFALAIALVVYLNVLALSLQVPVFDEALVQCFKVFLFLAAVAIGLIVTKRISVRTHSWPS